MPRNPRRRCFISAAGETDLSQLTAALRDFGYEVVVPTALRPGATASEAVQAVLRDVDLVIGREVATASHEEEPHPP